MNEAQEKELLLRVAALEMHLGAAMQSLNLLTGIVLSIGENKIPPQLTEQMKEPLEQSLKDGERIAKEGRARMKDLGFE